MDGNGRLAWDPAVEWTGGGLVSTSRDLAAWGRALFTGLAMDAPYLDRLLDGVAVAPGVLYGDQCVSCADMRKHAVDKVSVPFWEFTDNCINCDASQG